MEVLGMQHRGMVVGELDQTIGEDIGLVDPAVSLSNEFFSYDCAAKALVRTSDIQDDDIVGVDSCFHKIFEVDNTSSQGRVSLSAAMGFKRKGTRIMGWKASLHELTASGITSNILLFIGM
jgi:hypothetical protein